jgi:hypothetical protein
VAAKKAAILERALSCNPRSVSLLRALLRVAGAVLEPPALVSRWEAALGRWQAEAGGASGERDPAAAVDGALGELALWRDYLQLRHALFAAYTFADVQVSSFVSELKRSG